MSAPVDVLATLDWADEQVRAGAVRASDAETRRVAAGIREARAAVAELMEAATEYDNAIAYRDEWIDGTVPFRAAQKLADTALIRLRAAIARCGAAK